LVFDVSAAAFFDFGSGGGADSLELPEDSLSESSLSETTSLLNDGFIIGLVGFMAPVTRWNGQECD
jgi:hypothetical protein